MNTRYKSVSAAYDKEFGCTPALVSGRQYLLVENLISLCHGLSQKQEYLDADSARRKQYLINLINIVTERPYGLELDSHRKIAAQSRFDQLRYRW
jgi:hypothetical protein